MTWNEKVLEKVPHGEEGSLANLDGNELMTMINLLNHKGYAVCVTAGDIGDTFNIAWIYAGDTGNLQYANYNNIAFTHVDYIDDYPKAWNETVLGENEDESEED